MNIPHHFRRSGQLHSMEVIAVLFVFFVLVLFGVLFYFQLQRSGLEEQKATLASEDSLTISLNALFLPELRCSKGDNIPVKDCIDVYKLEAAQERMRHEQDYYFGIFHFARVSVSQIYPEPEHEWVLYNQTKEKATRVLKTPVPVSLFEPVQRTFRYGVLTIETYS